METETEKEIGEIQESTRDPTDGSVDDPTPIQTATAATVKVPEVEIHLYRCGKGPIAVFKSNLGGWEQDQLEVRDILEKYGFKSIYAFNPGSGRGVPIRFHPRNGRSMLEYKDGAVVYIDGEPTDSLIKPVTRILIGVAVITVFITLVLRDTPEWLKKLNIFGGDFPPWVLACMVIVFTRMRKRTKDFLNKLGW
ncbi:hypothetical protein SLEP1_g41075 [Rubroshorea leprosula]|uniref:Uncharacterized protein n=1 Tax=Rubroshorea leprosula TaxID=152421 RepID=A0AAV5L5C3_9ROSI|nr:hypothetical protein SLEP1_g41075 [Rubroshorea leprosula]